MIISKQKKWCWLLCLILATGFVSQTHGQVKSMDRFIDLFVDLESFHRQIPNLHIQYGNSIHWKFVGGVEAYNVALNGSGVGRKLNGFSASFGLKYFPLGPPRGFFPGRVRGYSIWCYGFDSPSRSSNSPFKGAFVEMGYRLQQLNYVDATTVDNSENTTLEKFNGHKLYFRTGYQIRINFITLGADYDLGIGPTTTHPDYPEDLQKALDRLDYGTFIAHGFRIHLGINFPGK